MSGWNTRRPNPGAISTTKMADPMAIGSAKIVERIVTANEPVIIGSAPIFGVAVVEGLMRVPFGSREEAEEIDAVDRERGDAAGGDHGDERHDKERHERDARTRDALTDPLDAMLRQLMCHELASPFVKLRGLRAR